MLVAPMEFAGWVPSAWSIVGNVFGMIPRSMHASLLRNSLSVLLLVSHIDHLPGGPFFSLVFS